MAGLNLTREIDMACVDFNKVCNLYSTSVAKLPSSSMSALMSLEIFVSHFSFVIKCYVTFMLFTKCHSCLCPVINFPHTGAVVCMWYLLSFC